ncbi:MAG: hypothetical protein WC073_08615 [Sterolibacterium sp.]
MFRGYMAIDSAISNIGLLKVSPGHDDKAKQGGHKQDGKKKQPPEESAGPHPILNEQGQTTGKLIDITA